MSNDTATDSRRLIAGLEQPCAPGEDAGLGVSISHEVNPPHVDTIEVDSEVGTFTQVTEHLLRNRHEMSQAKAA